MTKRSGKGRKYWHVHQRWACDKHLRHAIYLFAEQSLSRCVCADIYYQHHRLKNHSHANAIRRLGHRWLKIIYKMWMDRTPYDPELHHHNQLQHGSWIFQLACSPRGETAGSENRCLPCCFLKESHFDESIGKILNPGSEIGSFEPGNLLSRREDGSLSTC
jgi:hypothetical protein